MTDNESKTERMIGVLGGNGFLGSEIVKYFSSRAYRVSAITRENYSQFTSSYFDVLINANGNSRRFWANQHPEEDYIISVESVKKTLKDFIFGTYVFISSSDVYPDHSTPMFAKEDSIIDEFRLETYGLHKYQAEQLVKQSQDYLILRCSAMVGPGLKKGVVRDILDDSNLFVTEDSYLQFITTADVSRCIKDLLKKNIRSQILNCGGHGSISVSELCSFFGKKCHSRSDAQLQQYEIDVSKIDSLIGIKSSQNYVNEFKNLT